MYEMQIIGQDSVIYLNNSNTDLEDDVLGLLRINKLHLLDNSDYNDFKVISLDGSFTRLPDSVCYFKDHETLVQDAKLFELQNSILTISNINTNSVVIYSPYVVLYGDNYFNSLVIKGASKVVVFGNLHTNYINIETGAFINKGQITHKNDSNPQDYADNALSIEIASQLIFLSAYSKIEANYNIDLNAKGDVVIYGDVVSILGSLTIESIDKSIKIKYPGKIGAEKGIFIHADYDIELGKLDKLLVSRLHNDNLVHIVSNKGVCISSAQGSIFSSAYISTIYLDIYAEKDININSAKLTIGSVKVVDDNGDKGSDITSVNGKVVIGSDIVSFNKMVNIHTKSLVQEKFFKEDVMYNERVSNWFETFVHHTNQKKITGDLLGKILQKLYHEPMSFLDIGCGEGTLAKQLMSNFKNITKPIQYIGLDQDDYFLELSKIRLLNITNNFSTKFIQGNCFTDGLSSIYAQASIALASHIVYYTDKVDDFINKITQTLRKNGVVIFIHEAPSSDINRLRVWHNAPTNTRTSKLITDSLAEQGIPYYNMPLSEAFLEFPDNIELLWGDLKKIAYGERYSMKLTVAKSLLEFIIQRPLEALDAEGRLESYITFVQRVLEAQQNKLIIRSQITIGFNMNDTLGFLNNTQNSDIFSWSNQNLTYLLNFQQNNDQLYQS